MITCREAVRQLWEYLDGAVEEEARAKIDEHLGFCRRCCGEVEFGHELRRFLVEHGKEELPADVHARLRATLDTLENQR
ncbi:MAG: anti-sigma factor family protein [Acidimicrobiia bacterium]